MESGIYLITCDSDRGRYYYVGQSINVKKRISQHKQALKSRRHDNKIMQSLWGKYGASRFAFSLLEPCPTHLLNKTENWWLGQMVGHRMVINIGTTAESPLRGIKLNQEHKNKIADAIKGEKHYLYGKTMPKDIRQKISESGHGKKRSATTRSKISAATTGTKNPMHGIVGKNNPRSKPVVGFPVEGGAPIKFDSANSAKAHGFAPSEITHCCKGRYVTHRGYIWEYDDGEIIEPQKSHGRFTPKRLKNGKFSKWVPAISTETLK